VLGGGAVPPGILLGPLLAVALAAAVPFGGRRIGPAGAIAMLAVGQLGLHEVLDAIGTMGCGPTAAQMTGHAHTVQLVCTAGSGAAHVADPGGTAMLALHAAATLVTALLIAGTDRALTWVRTWLRPLVALLGRVALPACALLPVRVETARVVRSRFESVVPLRGPPARPAHATLAA
jgi:hypothetical protein